MKHVSSGTVDVTISGKENLSKASVCSCGKLHPIRKRKIFSGKVYRPETEEFIIGSGKPKEVIADYSIDHMGLGGF